MITKHSVSMGILIAAWLTSPALAAGHGPVFGAATPVLGRGGWSIDQAWTSRTGDEKQREQMLKTMLSFGLTEDWQVSGSFPLAMSDGTLAPARMMSAMSSDREFEGLSAYRFERRTVGIGGRQESTVYVGGTTPFGSTRNGVNVGPSVEAGISTGFASRAHYVWVGGGLQHFFERDGQRFGSSRLITGVYGYRPAALRTEAGKPDLRFFVEVTAENRAGAQTAAAVAPNAARTVFVGPTALLLHKAVGVEGGVLFPAYEAVAAGTPTEHIRVAVNVTYFFWLK
jgi:hypothetical protein